MATTDEAAIQEILDGLSEAWSRGDAEAYSARYRADGTFTNVNGTFHVGREEFERRHAEVFGGMFKGTTLTLTSRKLRFIRPDVAALDVDAGVFGRQALPGVEVGADGAMHSSLLMVLVKEAGDWWIDTYHNVWRAAAPH